MGFLKQVNKREKARYSFELKTMGNESSFYDGKKNSRKKIIFLSLAVATVLVSIYWYWSGIQAPQEGFGGEALEKYAEEAVGLAESLGRKKKYFLLLGIYIVLVAYHRYGFIKKLIKKISLRKTIIFVY